MEIWDKVKAVNVAWKMFPEMFVFVGQDVNSLAELTHTHTHAQDEVYVSI